MSPLQDIINFSTHAIRWSLNDWALTPHKYLPLESHLYMAAVITSVEVKGIDKDTYHNLLDDSVSLADSGGVQGNEIISQVARPEIDVLHKVEVT